MGVLEFLRSVARLVLLPVRFSLVYLYRCFSALVNWSLESMANSVPYPAMGNSQSLSYEEDQRAFDTEYDSTWEGDDDDIPEAHSSEFNITWSHGARRYQHAAKDMQNFRHMLRKVKFDDPANDEELDQMCTQKEDRIPNLLFYQNKRKFRPNGVCIEEFHNKWLGDYNRLEWVHTYIQWLFPIQKKGVNYHSRPLTEEEIKLFCKDDTMKKRLLESYKLMLDFYGIKLLDEKTGKVDCAENWKERFENLDRNTHNSLRITHILKCLGILGFEHYQVPLVKFFLKQTLVKGRLPEVKQSVLDYFMFSVLNKSERKKLIKFAFENFERKGEFVWCPKRIQRRFLKEIKTKKAETPETELSESESSEGEEVQQENEEVSNPQDVEKGESSGVRKGTDTDHNVPGRMKLISQKDQEEQSDTTTEKKNINDSDKGRVESVEQRPCGSGNKSPITASEGNTEEMSLNMESGTTGTDKMEIDSSSEISKEEKIPAIQTSDGENTDEITTMETDHPKQEGDCHPAATKESADNNGSKDSEDSGQFRGSGQEPDEINRDKQILSNVECLHKEQQRDDSNEKKQEK